MFSAAVLAAVFCLCGCLQSTGAQNSENEIEQTVRLAAEAASEAASREAASQAALREEPYFALDLVPEYSDSPTIEVHHNVPYYTEEELGLTDCFEKYSPLDELGRCGPAFALVGPETMPQEPRGQIGAVRPSGWHTVKYEGIDGNYLYNRCHLIAYILSGQNSNERNLITGTRYLNIVGMLPFEIQTADYIRTTGKHVLYRVTPQYVGSELVARGVLMEARSVEDKGAGLQFCVYVYNVQPGISISYADGESSGTAVPMEGWLASHSESAEDAEADAIGDAVPEASEEAPAEIPEGAYILNTGTGKFHRADCENAASISEKNREITQETREQLLERGYTPCGVCRP